MSKRVVWGAAAALGLAGAASAQSTATDPSHPGSFAPPLRYESAFTGYRPLGEDGVGQWRQVNDRVRDAAAERGGHAHAQGTGSPPKPPPAPSGTPSGATGAKR